MPRGFDGSAYLESLKRMPLDELRAQRKRWKTRLSLPAHSEAKKEYASWLREVDRQIDNFPT